MLLVDKTVKAALGIFLASAIATSTASAGVIWDEATDGSLSTDRLSPTTMGTLAPGSNDLIGSTVSGISKFFSITIGAGTERTYECDGSGSCASTITRDTLFVRLGYHGRREKRRTRACPGKPVFIGSRRAHAYTRRYDRTEIKPSSTTYTAAAPGQPSLLVEAAATEIRRQLT